MEFLIWIIFFTLGLFLWGLFYITIPLYLADKTIKVLFSSLLVEKSFPRGWWYNVFFTGVTGMMIISLGLLLIHLEIDLHLQIPTWVIWVPEQLYHMYHRFKFPIPIAMFFGRFVAVLFFNRILCR